MSSKTVYNQVLGTIVILASAITKVPQIYKIYQNKSGEGLSLFSINLELLSTTIFIFYNYLKHYPFSAWGESVFAAIQTAIIGTEILYYETSTNCALIYAFGYAFLCFLLYNDLLSIVEISALQSMNVVISLSSKIIQIFTNFRNGHTGQLSAITPFLTLIGTLIRIYTSIKETNDTLIVSSCIASAMATFIIAAQVIYYWDNHPNLKEK